jgi:hypothetical protein
MRDFYALHTGLHKGLRPAILRFFSRPQNIHSSANVIPLLPRILHKKSTDRGRPSAGLDLLSRPCRTRHSNHNSKPATHNKRWGGIERKAAHNKRRAPPRMRWRGPPDLAAQTPLLMLSVHATRSTTKPDTRLKSQLPGSSCVRGAPRWFPFSVVRDFYAYPGLLHKGFRPAISRFFRRPQTIHSSARVIPLLAWILHRKSTGELSVVQFRARPATLWSQRSVGRQRRRSGAGRLTLARRRRQANGGPAGTGQPRAGRDRPAEARAGTGQWRAGTGRASGGRGSGRRSG